MSVLKVIEILGNSTENWEDATLTAVKHASKSIKSIKSAFVQSQSVVVEGNDIIQYRVNVKITFEVKDDD
ncbi:MAG: dodecin family protein [Bacteroidota bacterium]